MVCCLFCFFKQKTAYEMRISDWSSDVCSSDLTPFKQWQGAAKIAPQRQLVGGPGFRSAPLGRKRQGGGEITQHSPGLPLGRALKTQLALLRQASRRPWRLPVSLQPRGAGVETSDRKSVVWGKSGSIRGESGGRR